MQANSCSTTDPSRSGPPGNPVVARRVNRASPGRQEDAARVSRRDWMRSVGAVSLVAGVAPLALAQASQVDAVRSIGSRRELFVDRFLYTSMRYPGNYGFIPHTLSEDGDPCDVIIANTRAIAPGAVMNCRIVGVMLMEDEAGGDEKLIAVPSSKLTQRYDHVKNYTDLPDITLKQIQHFFEHYKDLEPGKWVKVVRWGDASEAHAIIQEGVERAKAEKKS